MLCDRGVREPMGVSKPGGVGGVILQRRNPGASLRAEHQERIGRGAWTPGRTLVM